MGERKSLFADARRKLVEGTEVLRTGGGTSLRAGECHAILNRLSDLETALDKAWRFEQCYQESLGAVWTLPMQERLESLQSAFIDAYQESKGAKRKDAA